MYAHINRPRSTTPGPPTDAKLSNRSSSRSTLARSGLPRLGLAYPRSGWLTDAQADLHESCTWHEFPHLGAIGMPMNQEAMSHLEESPGFRRMDAW